MSSWALGARRAAPDRAAAATWRWERPALLGLLGLTALAYLWDLGASGWANAFYSAAVQAGSVSWKAFFFGSLDASSFITVDKSPAALWLMEISVRIFGLSSWSILVPQALEGVATVAVVYLAVRRWFGPGAGLLAGSIVALTPVAALMFRFNNPDALLVLLLTGAGYATLRAVESGRTRWLVLGAALIGTAFLAKMLQAFVIVPVVGGLYLMAGPPRLAARIKQLALAAVALLVSSGWWVAIVELVPAADRPYVGGSQNNSVLNLVLGYNGLGRLTGNETGSVGGVGAAGSMWGATGWDRLFNASFGGQASWLIPGALILLAAGLWLTRGRPRTDLPRASLLLWGGTLVVTGAVFSYAQGIIHPYYTVALAPSIGAVIGIGASMLWARRARRSSRLALAIALAVTAVWAFILLGRSPDFLPGLRWVVLVGGLAAAPLIAELPRLSRLAAVTLAGAALALALAGPAAYTVDTVLTAHAGAIPSAGPAVAAADGGGPPGAGGRGGFGGPPGGGALTGGPPAGGPPPGFAPPAGGGGGFVGGGGAPGGFLRASTPSAALVKLLQTGASKYRWVAATVDANNAAGYQLGTGEPVMAIGGFNGTDPAPTLAQFQAFVRAGQIHYFIAGGGGFGGGFGSGAATASSQITAWVQARYTAQTVGGVTIYDLSPTG